MCIARRRRKGIRELHVLTVLVSFVVFPACTAFLSKEPSTFQRMKIGRPRSQDTAFFATWDDNLRELRAIQERQKDDALLDAIFLDVVSTDNEATAQSLLSIHLSGQARVPILTNKTRTTLSDSESIALILTDDAKYAQEPAATVAMLLPLPSRSQLKLVSFAAARRPLSKSVLLGLNTLLVNRDGALFDNLPWSTWSVDPQMRNRDAAKDSIDPKFHLGKRDAYNRFMGKDWQGRSLAIGNMALRLKYMLEKDEDTEDNVSDVSVIDEEDSQTTLARRILQLRIRELQMDLAGITSQLAVARNNGGDCDSLENEQARIADAIAAAKDDLVALDKAGENASSGISKVLDQVADWTTENGRNEAPYRGATGYAPRLDTKGGIDESLLPCTSPYDFLKEILEDQLNAKVIGCILENTSLLKGNLAVGGAVVMQRLTPSKVSQVAGERMEYADYDEDFGNEGVKAGETIIVECDSDEAIGMALAFNVTLKVESNIYQRTAVPVAPLTLGGESGNIIEHLPLWQCVDTGGTFEMEGETQISKQSNPVSIPRTTTSLFESIFEEKPASPGLFPTDNPIKSLDEYDSLSNEAKAKILLELSSFSGKLPRPRVVRKSKKNPLDEMLLPLIDESVRRQYYIRDAEESGDFARAEELRAERSRRQMAKEKATEAMESGVDHEFEQWSTEAEFLESLRADVTQDEGSYSRFLDRDYWYEKDRQATAKRVDRSKFGNLLDGLD